MLCGACVPAFPLLFLCWRGRPLGRVPSRPPAPRAVVGFPARAAGGAVSVLFGSVLGCSFSRLGRLFSGLGRLSSGVGGVGCVLFFRSFVVSFGLVPWLLPLLFRLRSLCARAGGLPFSAGLRWPCSGFPLRLGFCPRSASRLRVPALPLGFAVILVAGGRWAGRWLAPAPLRSACPCVRAVSPRLASSFACFLSFF